MPEEKPAKKLEYDIIGGERYAVVEEVRRWIEEGWEPLGGPVFVRYHDPESEAWIGQAMTRRVEAAQLPVTPEEEQVDDSSQVPSQG